MAAAPTDVPSSALRHLASIVGDDHVIRDAGRRRSYEQDWSGRFTGQTPAVVRPANVDEVAECLACCNDERIAVVPQGGNTGLVGGGVPLNGEVVLHLGRLNRIEPVDELAAQVTVGAGATVAAVQRHATAAGLVYPVDLASRDSATIGGTIATNAGGLRVLRYGPTRAQLAGIEMVLASGAVVSHLGGLLKDNTGYDLPGLVCGSEGTLAVVTRARLRLVAPSTHRITALVGVADVQLAVQAMARWRHGLPDLEAAELFLASGLQLVRDSFGWPAPLPHDWPVYLLVDVAGAEDPTDRVAEVIGGDPATGDVAVASDSTRRGDLWRYREEHTSAINRHGVPHKLDVTLPFGRLAAFIDEVPERVKQVAPNAEVWLFGHVGDGNVHVNITGVPIDDDAVDEAVLTLVADRGGSISAEHGIGTAKRRWLGLGRSPTEIATFRTIKHALDPHGILNPNVLLP